jgi:aquaporin Z
MAPRATTDRSAQTTWARRLSTEVFGTFALVFVAVGADASASFTNGAVSDAARAVAPALVVMAMIYAIADGSGAHFNPAVSLSFTLKRLFPPTWLLPYWGAQLVGALAACLVVSAILGSHVEAGVSTPHGISAGAATVLELLLTSLLLVVILGTADRARLVGPNAALAVGGTIALCGLVALPLESASMNPARSLAPALVTGHLDAIGIYLLGPFLAAPLAVGLTRLLHGPTERDPKAVEAAQGEEPSASEAGRPDASADDHGRGETRGQEDDRSRRREARPSGRSRSLRGRSPRRSRPPNAPRTAG